MNCLIFALLLLVHSWAGAGLERVASVCRAVLSAHSMGVDRAPVRVASLRTLTGQPTETQTRGVWVPPATEGFPSADLPPADLDGNSKGDSRWAYEWDGENRLIKVTSQAAAVSAGAPYQMLTFRYDALGRLLERKEIGTSAAASGSILGKPPKDGAWHHDTRPGIMKLVPKSQHPDIPGGIFLETLHPGGNGGGSIWGKGRYL